MRILVTGGAGFIGSHLAAHFYQLGHEVTVLDDFSTGRIENLEDVQSEICIIEGSIVEERTLRFALDKMDVVLHHAAIPSVVDSLRNPVGTAQVNLQGTVLLLEECRRAEVGRIVFASSSAVYGEPLKCPISEVSPTLPLSPYGAHKLAAEHLMRVSARNGGPDSISLRYFNVYGPHQRSDSDYAAVIPLFRARCESDEKPIIYGDGRQTRDFIHVNDVVRINQLAVESPRLWMGTRLNVACEEATRIDTLARLIMDQHHMDGEPEYASPRAGEIQHSVADTTRLREALNWVPEISLEQGLHLQVPA